MAEISVLIVRVWRQCWILTMKYEVFPHFPNKKSSGKIQKISWRDVWGGICRPPRAYDASRRLSFCVLRRAFLALIFEQWFLWKMKPFILSEFLFFIRVKNLFWALGIIAGLSVGILISTYWPGMATPARYKVFALWGFSAIKYICFLPIFFFSEFCVKIKNTRPF